MDREVARALNAVNTRFYARVHGSFSETRTGAWPGWERVAQEAAGLQKAGGMRALRVLDAACGNLRFERFLQGELGEGACDFFALDSCDELVERDVPICYRHADLVEGALAGESMRSLFADELGECADAASVGGCCAGGPSSANAAAARTADGFDLAVSFGFLHHVPGFETRVHFLRDLLACVRPGGAAAVSLWRFMDDGRLAAKAEVSHAKALAALAPHGIAQTNLEAGDHFLGWQDEAGVYRYCHHFSEEETTALAEAVADLADVAARYKADGKTNDLNHYLMFRRK